MRKKVFAVAMLALLVMSAIAVFAVPAFAQPVGEQFCSPWTWAWFGSPGNYYWQWFDWCYSPWQGWYRIWGGWGV